MENKAGMKKEKVDVSEKVIFERIDSKLAPGRRRLRRCRRDSSSFDDLGEYYIVSTLEKCIIDTHIDLETYAKDMGLLAEYEQLCFMPSKKPAGTKHPAH